MSGNVKTYSPIRPSAIPDATTRYELQKMDEYLRSLSAFVSRVPALPQGTPSATVTPPQTVDLSLYFYLPGRAGGQTGFGSTATSAPVTGQGLQFQGYNNFVGSATDRSARMEMIQDITMRCDNFFVVERDSTYGSGDGFQITTGLGFVNVGLYGGQLKLNANTAGGSPQFVIDNTAPGSSIAQVLEVIKKKSGQTGDMTQWQNNLGTKMSYIRASDGAFVGPVVASGTDSHIDTIFQILNNADNTKVAMFDASGIATATTRTFTFPDVTATLLCTQGASAGQVIGTTAHSGGTASSLAIEGPVMIGDGIAAIAFVSGTALAVRNVLPEGGAIGMSYTADLTSLGAINPVASGTYSFLNVNSLGLPVYTSGTFAIRGLTFNPTLTLPSGVTLSSVIAVFVDGVFGSTAGGTVSAYYGGLFRMRRPASAGPTFTDIVGVASSPTNTANASTTMRGFLALRSTITLAVTYGAGTVTDAVAFDVDSTFAAAAQFTNWSGLRIPAISGPGTIWGLNITGTMNNRLAGKLALGTSTAPSHLLDFGAGTATVAVMRIPSGTDLTSATDGCVEYDGTDKKFTIGTSRLAHSFKNRAETITGQKTFTTDPVLANTASLRGTDSLATVRTILTCLNTDVIRYAPLSNAGGFTWTDISGNVKLTFTVGATPLMTFADPVNLAFGTVTGTKFGTATTQLLSFWNAVPITQPTTAIAASTFVANTSGIANDSATWDGYTVGQVVKALRNVGLLA